MDKVEACGDRTANFFTEAWSWYKSRSKGFFLLFSMVLAAMSFLLISGGGFLMATLSTSTGEVVGGTSIAFGAVILLVTVIGVVGYVKKNPRIAKAQFVICIILFLVELVLASIATTYLNQLRIVSDEGDDRSSDEYSGSIAKTVNDFTLSAYVYCCTGCDPTLDTCESYQREIRETEYCSSVAEPTGDLTEDEQAIVDGKCLLVPPCESFDDGDSSLDVSRCFTKPSSNGTYPTFTTPSSFCDFLEDSSWGSHEKPIVGSAGGTTEDGVSCGGRDPKVFQLSIYDWARTNHAWVATLVAFTMILQIGAGSASLAYSIQYADQNSHKRVKDQRRPFDLE